MTKQKSFKRRVRSRMQKTNESYSAARRQLISASDLPSKRTGADLLEQPSEAVPAIPEDRSPAPQDSGVGAIRKAEDAIREKTGRDWDGWFALLDEWGAETRPHPEIASWLSSEHGVGGWWAQSITVAYEQARGIRAPGQGRDGKYTVSASKTVNVPLEELFRAVQDPGVRGRWLQPDLLQVTGSTPGKSVRGRWNSGDTRVVVGFTVKGDEKTLIGLAHEKIADPETARTTKAFWADRLKALKELLEA